MGIEQVNGKSRRRMYTNNQVFWSLPPSERHLQPSLSPHKPTTGPLVLHNRHSMKATHEVSIFKAANTHNTHLFSIEVAKNSPKAPIRGITVVRRPSTHTVVSSSLGGTVASLYTASHAVSRSKPVIPLRTASAIRESACVPTCAVFVSLGIRIYTKVSVYHDTRFWIEVMVKSWYNNHLTLSLTNDIFPHRQPSSLTKGTEMSRLREWI